MTAPAGLHRRPPGERPPARVATVVRADLARVARSRWTAVLLLLSVAATVLVGYVAVHTLLGLVDGAGSGSDGVQERLRDLSPARLRVGMASVVTATLPVAALLSGGLLVRAEYGGHLLRLLLGRGHSRTTLALGKVVALAALCLVASTVTAAAGLAAAVVLTGARASTWPDAGDVLVVLVVGALSWLTWSLLGLLSALVVRSAHAASALAVAWLLTSGVTSALTARDDALGALARLGPASTAHEVLVGPAGWSAPVGLLLLPLALAAGCVLAVRLTPVD